MTPSKLRASVVLERIRWISEMVAKIRALPLETYEAFVSSPHTEAAAESYLRRGLEALFDLARHLLSKGFGLAPAEYKGIAQELGRNGVLTQEQARLMAQMAGYRNRMVHFYNELSAPELYEICTKGLPDIEQITAAIEAWIRDHPDRIDQAL